MSEEEYEYEITPELVTEISKKSVRESQRISERLAKILGKLSKIREILLEKKEQDAKIVRMEGIDIPEIPACYAIDSSFKSPLPLVFGDLFIVIGGYVRYPRVKGADTTVNRGLRVLVRCREELTSRVQSAISKIVERRIALEILEHKEYDQDDRGWKILMFDGPLVPLWPIILFTRSLYRQEEKLLEMSRKIASICRNRRKTMLGIVKRVRTHFIGRGIIRKYEELGILTGLEKETIKAMKEANDKALATLLLEPGEALIIGKYGESEIIELELKEVGRKGAFDEFINNNEWVKDVIVAFIKPKRSKHVIRLEILDYGGIGTEKILAWINENSSHTACPHVLDIVDKYTAISNIIYELARKIIIKNTTRTLSSLLENLDVEEIDILLDLADLQKKYIPRMG